MNRGPHRRESSRVPEGQGSARTEAAGISPEHRALLEAACRGGGGGGSGDCFNLLKEKRKDIPDVC